MQPDLKDPDLSLDDDPGLANAATDMGWHFVIENNVENIDGIVTGAHDYIKRTFKYLCLS